MFYTKEKLNNMLRACSYIHTLAIAATKGEWVAVGRHVENANDALPDIVLNREDRNSDLDSHIQQTTDAQYIASVQPRIILELLKEREELILALMAEIED